MDSDSSSESDDDFLTISDKSRGNVDREALIRKKLLESFYGQPAASSSSSAAAERSGNDGGSGAYARDQGRPNQTGNRHLPEERRNSADTKDLDSPYFDVAAHTSHHIVNSSVHKLLEMDEQLTLQVRTLDSSTQNMVYENYSKFIDATEAVKSVGVNVQANEQGLERLRGGMEIINEQSRLVEEDLGSLRDAVAEKIRVKRLLTRLDALLKLPVTLRDQIAACRYRTAASSFCRSTNILSKHSAGFESLQKIETECNGILQDMMKDLNRKILYWSGQENALAMMGSGSFDDNSDSGLGDAHGSGTGDDDDDDELPPDPPKSISEIFECAGTLAMLVNEKPAGLDPGITLDNCKMMSLSAATRLLDRLFDTHQLEIQEAVFSATLPAAHVMDESGAYDGDHSTRSQQPQKGHHLVPTLITDSILEAATLFCMSFHEGGSQQANDSASEHLVEFVGEAYASFLSHVRGILLEHSLTHGATGADNEEHGEGDGDEVYEDIAGAMSILLHSVRELASGLSLPEVGISADFAAELVEQASELTETLVRRRVEQKFCDLRLRVVTECLAPFATRVAGGNDEGETSPDKARTVQVVQIAVSDCLQLLDDTVRSIVSGREVLGASAASVDLPILKQCIQASTGRFASWLAGTLEVLAGCECSDPNFSIEASSERAASADEVAEASDAKRIASAQRETDDISEMSYQHDPLAEKVDSAIQDLLVELEGKGNDFSHFSVTIKVYEICRAFERAFVDSMNQSIGSNVGGGKKGRASGLFPMDDNKRSVVLSSHERKTTERFRLAASRILTLYATDQAFAAANILCSHLDTIASTEEGVPDRPSIAVCRVLEIAKQASSDCAELFSESKRGGPPPNFANPAPASQPLLGMNMSPLKGLQLDVERMFQEKILIFPHPGEVLESSKNAVLTVFFKVVFKALVEQTRQCTLSSKGCLLLLVDVEFLREMVFHYIQENFQIDGANACSSLSTLLTDILSSAGERCLDEDSVGNDDLVRTARSVLREFMKSDPFTLTFLISEED